MVLKIMYRMAGDNSFKSKIQYKYREMFQEGSEE